MMFNAFGVKAIRPQRGRRSKPRVAEGGTLGAGGRTPSIPFSYTFQSSTLRSRSALRITETELSVMAMLAIMGLSSRWKNG